MSHLKQVAQFNRAVGNVVNDSPTPASPIDLYRRLALIEEEVRELRDAIESEDYVEMIDALADIEYVTLGFATMIGADLDAAFDAVHANNMTKLCDQDYAATMCNVYKNSKGADGLPLDPAYRAANGINKFVVYDQRSGKILKPNGYRPVDLSHLWK